MSKIMKKLYVKNDHDTAQLLNSVRNFGQIFGPVSDFQKWGRVHLNFKSLKNLIISRFGQLKVLERSAHERITF